MQFYDTKNIRSRINRPKGSLPKQEIYEDLYLYAKKTAEKLSKYDEIIGITLTGGISRGYADELSEIDLDVYIIQEYYEKWIMGEGPTPQGDFFDGKQHMDISFLSLEDETKKSWNLIRKWDASYQEILYDPKGKIQKLLDKKDVFSAEEKYTLALSKYIDCVYMGGIVISQWIKRNDPLVANQLIGQAVSSLAELVFLANEEYPPFNKWLINYSYSLKWLPNNWKNRIESIVLTKEITLDEVKRRNKEFIELYKEIWEKIVGPEYKEIGLLELKELEKIQFLAQNSPSVEEFSKKFDKKSLSYEVLYKLTCIKQRNGSKHIEFDEKKYNDEKQHNFSSFLHWNRKMLEHLEL